MSDIVERLGRTYDMYPQDVAELRAEIERLRALVEECLRYMHNDFEPDNQSAAYYRIRRALEGK